VTWNRVDWMLVEFLAGGVLVWVLIFFFFLSLDLGFGFLWRLKVVSGLERLD
jgi:hypothetical protein